MSLSFPGLISAVPLYAVDHGTDGRIVRQWMSDGGISSNFPIHFFDRLLPSHPTFGINLQPLHPTKPQMVERPRVGQSRMSVRMRPLGALTSFAGAILDTMQNWADTSQATLKGYADRVVEVRQTPVEGGLNLRMPEDRILTLAHRGKLAGEELATFDWGCEPHRPVPHRAHAADRCARPPAAGLDRRRLGLPDRALRRTGPELAGQAREPPGRHRGHRPARRGHPVVGGGRLSGPRSRLAEALARPADVAPMSAAAGLACVGALGLAVLAGFGLAHRAAERSSDPPVAIVAFQLVGTGLGAHDLLDRLGGPGRRAARRCLALDPGIILGYVLALAGLGGAAVACAGDRLSGGLRIAAILAAGLAAIGGVVAGSLDLYENAQLGTILDRWADPNLPAGAEVADVKAAHRRALGLVFERPAHRAAAAARAKFTVFALAWLLLVVAWTMVYAGR